MLLPFRSSDLYLSAYDRKLAMKLGIGQKMSAPKQRIICSLNSQ